MECLNKDMYTLIVGFDSLTEKNALGWPHHTASAQHNTEQRIKEKLVETMFIVPLLA